MYMMRVLFGATVVIVVAAATTRLGFRHQPPVPKGTKKWLHVVVVSRWRGNHQRWIQIIPSDPQTIPLVRNQQSRQNRAKISIVGCACALVGGGGGWPRLDSFEAHGLLIQACPHIDSKRRQDPCIRAGNYQTDHIERRRRIFLLFLTFATKMFDRRLHFFQQSPMMKIHKQDSVYLILWIKGYGCRCLSIQPQHGRSQGGHQSGT